MSDDEVNPSPSRSPSGVPHVLRRIPRSTEFTTPSPLKSPGLRHVMHCVCACAAQVLSHSMLQQKLSAAQMSSQQAASEHAGVAWPVQQSPAPGAPQTSEHGAHAVIAASAQFASHSDSQQNGSCAHTVAQQVASEQEGVGCAAQQSPLDAAPHPGPQTPQTCRAVCAQALSHACEQHTGSTRQIERQHRSSEQPGVVRAVQQLPAAGLPHAPPQSPQRMSAASAQVASHSSSQQKPSSEQTAEQQSSSAQDGVVLAAQQLPASGSPQPMPHTPQICVALFAHTASHSDSQQNASIAQTALQQVASSQEGPSCGTQHAPVIGLPHSSAQTPQYSIASDAQLASHSTSQQKLSAAHTGTQQAGSAQAGVACASQQFPAAGSPQPTPQTPQTICALNAHCASHCVWQQNGSTEQSPSQQSGLLHPGSLCGMQQSPLSGSPQGSAQMPQIFSAAAAQY